MPPNMVGRDTSLLLNNPADGAPRSSRSSAQAQAGPSHNRRSRSRSRGISHRSRRDFSDDDDDDDDDDRSDDDDDTDSASSSQDEDRRARKRSRLSTPRGRSSSRRRSSGGRARSVSRSRSSRQDWDRMSLDSEDMSTYLDDAPTVVSIQGPSGIRFERVVDDKFPDDVESLKAVARRKFRLNEAEPVELVYRNPAGAECGLDDEDDLRAFRANAQRSSYLLLTVKAAVPLAFASPIVAQNSFQAENGDSPLAAASAAAAAAASSVAPSDTLPASTSDKPPPQVGSEPTSSRALHAVTDIPAAPPAVQTLKARRPSAMTPSQPRTARKRRQGRASVAFPDAEGENLPDAAQLEPASAAATGQQQEEQPPPQSALSEENGSRPAATTSERAAATAASASKIALEERSRADEAEEAGKRSATKKPAEERPATRSKKAGADATSVQAAASAGVGPAEAAPQVQPPAATPSQAAGSPTTPGPSASQAVESSIRQDAAATSTPASTELSKSRHKRGSRSSIAKAGPESQPSTVSIPAKAATSHFEFDWSMLPSVRDAALKRAAAATPTQAASQPEVRSRRRSIVAMDEHEAATQPAPGTTAAQKKSKGKAEAKDAQQTKQAKDAAGAAGEPATVALPEDARSSKKADGRKSKAAAAKQTEAPAGAADTQAGEVTAFRTWEPENDVEVSASGPEVTTAANSAASAAPAAAATDAASQATKDSAPPETPASAARKPRMTRKAAETQANQANAKATTQSTEAQDDNAALAATPAKPAKGKPGRKKAATAGENNATLAIATPKKRGRPSKADIAAREAAATAAAEADKAGAAAGGDAAEGETTPAVTAATAPESQSPPIRRRGRAAAAAKAAEEPVAQPESTAEPATEAIEQNDSEAAATGAEVSTKAAPKTRGAATTSSQPTKTPRKRKAVEDPDTCVYCEQSPDHAEAECPLLQEGTDDALGARLNALRYNFKKTPREKAAVSRMTSRLADIFKQKHRENFEEGSLSSPSSQSVRDLVSAMHSEDDPTSTSSSQQQQAQPEQRDEVATESDKPARSPARPAAAAEEPTAMDEDNLELTASQKEEAEEEKKKTEEQRAADELKARLKQKRLAASPAAKAEKEKQAAERAKAAAAKAGQRNVEAEKRRLAAAAAAEQRAARKRQTDAPEEESRDDAAPTATPSTAAEPPVADQPKESDAATTSSPPLQVTPTAATLAEAEPSSPLNEVASEAEPAPAPATHIDRPSATDHLGTGLRDASPSSEAELATSPMLQAVSRPYPSSDSVDAPFLSPMPSDVATQDVEMPDSADQLPPPNQQHRDATSSAGTPTASKAPIKAPANRRRSTSATSSDTSEDSEEEEDDDEDEEEDEDDGATEDEMDQIRNEGPRRPSITVDGPGGTPKAGGAAGSQKPSQSQSQRGGANGKTSNGTASTTAGQRHVAAGQASSDSESSSTDSDSIESSSNSDSDSGLSSSDEDDGRSKKNGPAARAASSTGTRGSNGRAPSSVAATPVQSGRNSLSSLNPYSTSKLSSLGRPSLAAARPGTGLKLGGFTKLTDLRPADLRRSLSQPNSPLTVGASGSGAGTQHNGSSSGLFKGRMQSNTPDSDASSLAPRSGGGGGGSSSSRAQVHLGSGRTHSTDQLESSSSSSDDSDSSDDSSSDEGDDDDEEGGPSVSRSGARKAAGGGGKGGASFVPASKRAGAAVKKPKKDKNVFTCFTR